jgi:hypothetical protein
MTDSTESYEQDDLVTLRAMAVSQGIAGADRMSHDELVDALRAAGLAEPGPAAQTPAEETGDSTYHGLGVGRREEST